MMVEKVRATNGIFNYRICIRIHSESWLGFTWEMESPFSSKQKTV